jgi:hypothetical protein
MSRAKRPWRKFEHSYLCFRQNRRIARQQDSVRPEIRRIRTPLGAEIAYSLALSCVEYVGMRFLLERGSAIHLTMAAVPAHCLRASMWEALCSIHRWPQRPTGQFIPTRVLSTISGKPPLFACSRVQKTAIRITAFETHLPLVARQTRCGYPLEKRRL